MVDQRYTGYGMPKLDLSTLGDLGTHYNEQQRLATQERTLAALGNLLGSGNVNYNQAAGLFAQLGQFGPAMSALQTGRSREAAAGIPGLLQEVYRQPSGPQPRAAAPGGPVQSTSTVMGDEEGVQAGLYDPPATPGARPPIQSDVAPVMAPSPNGPGTTAPTFSQRFPQQAGEPFTTGQATQPPVAPRPPQAPGPTAAAGIDPRALRLMIAASNPDLDERQSKLLLAAAQPYMPKDDEIKVLPDGTVGFFNGRTKQFVVVREGNKAQWGEVRTDPDTGEPIRGFIDTSRQQINIPPEARPQQPAGTQPPSPLAPVNRPPPGVDLKTYRREQGEAASKAMTALPKVRSSLMSLEGQWQVVDKTIDDALKNTGWFTSGLTGLPLSKTPGTPAYRLARDLETIRANIGFDKLQQMRDSSPTGGALGNVTENENKLLQATAGSIDQFQDEATLRKRLTTIKELVAKVKEERRSAFKETYPGVELPETPGSTSSGWQDVGGGIRIRKKQ